MIPLLPLDACGHSDTHKTTYMTSLPLIELPTRELLDKFGSGGHKPGSGSAAALMGLLSCKLILTVGQLTRARDKYREAHPQVDYLRSQIESEIEPRLKQLFERDAQVFDEVITLRRARDGATTEKDKRRLQEKHLDAMRVATEIPVEICELCIKLIDHGVSMFDIGFVAARGDTGAAISAAVAGAMSGIFVVNLNLRSFRGGEWAQARRIDCDRLHALLEAKQEAAFGRVVKLKEEDVQSMSFGFDTPSQSE